MLHCNCLMKRMLVNQMEDQFVILWSVYNSDENDELKSIIPLSNMRNNCNIIVIIMSITITKKNYATKWVIFTTYHDNFVQLPVSSYSNSSNFDVMVHLFWNSFKNTEIIPTYFKHLHMMHFVICNLNLIIQRFGLTDSAYFWTNIWT